jgi:hypothetical protein
MPINRTFYFFQLLSDTFDRIFVFALFFFLLDLLLTKDQLMQIAHSPKSRTLTTKANGMDTYKMTLPSCKVFSAAVL